MLSGRFVSYLRVSTDKQGRSGLGEEAQRRAVKSFLNGGSSTHLQEFKETESGGRNDRPELAKALALCRIQNATLLIAKLDRLSRDAHFLLGLQKAGVRFVAADMPEANEMVVGIMAIVAQAERKMISERTKAALAAAKAGGKRLGGLRSNSSEIHKTGAASSRAKRTAAAAARSMDLRPVITDIQAQGATSLRHIATALNARGIPAARGGKWSAAQVRRIQTNSESGSDGR